MPIPELVLLLDNADTARALRISPDELEALVAAGDLPPVYVHGKRRFVLQDVEALARFSQHRRP
jgi:hypothetical protein